MSRFFSANLPPHPTYPEEDHFDHGITTRVMAKQIQLQNDKYQQNSPQGSLTGRRNSRFLSGTSIPNSTIRSSLDNSNNVEVIEKNVSERSSHSSNNSEIEAVDKKRLSEERGMERMRKKIKSFAATVELPMKFKEERKSAAIRTFNAVMPRNKGRRSTLESIKDAIEKSPDIMKLVNADSMEKRDIGQHFKVLNLDSLPKEAIQKKDLQTQTSLLLEKILPPD